jgi:predicted O-methyltransferase YrrM
MSRTKENQRIKKLHQVTDKLAAIKNIFEVVEDPDSLDDFDKSKKLKERNFPYSCTDEEGMILYEAVNTLKLKSGFEIATAFGYSSLFLGLAFGQNKGKLISLDCYVEEWKDSFLYDFEDLRLVTEEVKKEVALNNLPIGLKYAQANRDKLGLQNNIDYQIGISPQDLPYIVKDKIDFAFIDGGHFGDQPTKDFLGVYPQLNEECIVFFHDNNNNPYVERAIKAAEEKFGTKHINYHTRYQLSVIGRNVDYKVLNKLKDYSLRYIHANPDIRPSVYQKTKSILSRIKRKLT